MLEKTEVYNQRMTPFAKQLKLRLAEVLMLTYRFPITTMTCLTGWEITSLDVWFSTHMLSRESRRQITLTFHLSTSA